MGKQADDIQIRASLDTLTRHVSENCRQQLRTLRAALDRQLSSLEATIEQGDHGPIIDAAVKHVSDAAAERANHARQQAEASAAQALAAIEVELRARLSSESAANTMLRTALDEAKKEIEAAQNKAAKAEAAQRATAAQHRETMNEQRKLTTALDAVQAQLLELQARFKNAQREAEINNASVTAAQHQVQELTAENDELLQRIKSLTAAKATADAQYRQLESVSQKLSSALSQMLREREPGRASAADLSTLATSLSEKDTAKSASAKAASPAKAAPTSTRIAPPPNPPTAAPAGAQKKPLPFSQKARDAKRVKIRRGIDVTVDGIPGELVDLSIGGAQALLRQAVKPNQLVRLMLLTAAGQIICKGRVVWVVYEQPGTSLSVYRTGVKFASDVDEAAVENFMNDFREALPMQGRHTSGVA